MLSSANSISSSLLTDRRYIDFLSRAHPHLNIRTTLDGAAYYSARIDITEVLRSPLKLFFSTCAAHIVPALTHPRMTVFGLPFEPYIQTPIIERLPSLSTIETIADNDGADLVAVTNANPFDEQARMLENRGFVALPSFPGMSVLLSTQHFEDYLQNLRAKDREDLRRNIRLFDRAGHRLRFATFLDDLPLHQAYVATRERSKIKWLSYSPDYFSQWQNAGNGARLIIAESRAGEFLGFVNLFFHDDRVHVARLAVAPAWHRRDAIYFRLLYCTVEQACISGVERVMLGPTAYRVKRRMGAQPQPLNNYFLPRSKLWRMLLPRARKIMVHQLNYMRSIEALERF